MRIFHSEQVLIKKKIRILKNINRHILKDKKGVRNTANGRERIDRLYKSWTFNNIRINALKNLLEVGI